VGSPIKRSVSPRSDTGPGIFLPSAFGGVQEGLGRRPASKSAGPRFVNNALPAETSLGARRLVMMDAGVEAAW